MPSVQSTACSPWSWAMQSSPQLLSGAQEIKLGSLESSRDFNYVKDTAAGFMAIAACDKAIGEEINIATGKDISIGQLAEELIRQINPPHAWCATPSACARKTARCGGCAAARKIARPDGLAAGLHL